MVAYNTNNMTVGELIDLTKKSGDQGLDPAAEPYHHLSALSLALTKPDNAEREFRQYLDNFYRSQRSRTLDWLATRNGINRN